MTATPMPPLRSAPAGHGLRFARFGGPEVLEVAPLPLPEPSSGEVRVRVEASSVQFTDTMIRRGVYPGVRRAPPHTPGYDLLGRVDAVGPGETRWSVGDRVADLCVTGGNARFALRPSAGLVRVPEGVDAAEAVALVLSWVTAEQVIRRVAKARAGERLLVLGANGAVGQALVARGVAAGLEVWASARETFHPALEAEGARPLPRSGWLEEVRAEGGVDVVVDGVGAFRDSYRALRRGGRQVLIGNSEAAKRGKLAMMASFIGAMLRQLWPDGKRSALYSIADRRKARPQEFAADLERLFADLEAGAIAPAVARRLRMDEVAEAHAQLEAGGLEGKLVLEPWA
jgi:NADPH2:quinone reductase